MNIDKLLSLTLSDLIQLRKPVTAAAVVALITQLIPGLHVNSVTISSILVGIGVVATFVENQVKDINTNTVTAVEQEVPYKYTPNDVPVKKAIPVTPPTIVSPTVEAPEKQKLS